MPTPKDQQEGEDLVRSEEDYDIEIIPERWNCVDCGVNTAPGLMNRVETEAAIKAAKDRGEDHVRIEDTYDANTEVYTVRNAIWEEAGWGYFLLASGGGSGVGHRTDNVITGR